MRTRQAESQPMDPVALTLALWLGLVASVVGLTRASEDAARQATLNQLWGKPAVNELTDINYINPQMVGFGS